MMFMARAIEWISAVFYWKRQGAPDGQARPVRTAYIAGVVPDDDYFWEVAKSQGFEVKRGYLGTNNRSKQDDAYLISEIVSTIYEKQGPSTIVLGCGGDADYMPP